MSPFKKPVIIDTDCISNLFSTGQLERFLKFWICGQFLVPDRVFNELHKWPAHGVEVCRIIHRLAEAGQVSIISIDENSEAETSAYLELRMRHPVLGQGESEVIAIARARNYIVATNDTVARARCKEVFPDIEVINTLGIIRMAKDDGLISLGEVDAIWNKIREQRH